MTGRVGSPTEGTLSVSIYNSIVERPLDDQTNPALSEHLRDIHANLDGDSLGGPITRMKLLLKVRVDHRPDRAATAAGAGGDGVSVARDGTGKGRAEERGLTSASFPLGHRSRICTTTP